MTKSRSKLPTHHSKEVVLSKSLPTDYDALRLLRRELAYDASLGADGAVDRLEAVEAAMVQMERAEERAELVAEEAENRAAEAARKAQEGKHKDLERQYQERIGDRKLALQSIEEHTATLASAIRHALAVETAIGELAVGLRLGPQARTANLIAHFVNWRLGRDMGGQEAGLLDMNSVLPQLRQQLVEPNK